MSLDVDRIGAVVDAAKSASDEFVALLNGLAQLATQSTRNRVVFDHEELRLQIISRGGFSRMIDRLKAIEPLKLGLAPVVAAVFSANEHDVLVLKYWAIPGEQRLAFDGAHRPAEPARRRFRDELLKLADAGWMHEWATRGSEYWRVGSKTETMVLEEWTVLQPIEDKDEVVAKISRMS
jgi:hypothetical protein